MKKETSQSPGSAQDRKMSKGELISYGLGGVASTMPSQFKTSYAMNFMSDVAGAPCCCRYRSATYGSSAAR